MSARKSISRCTLTHQERAESSVSTSISFDVGPRDTHALTTPFPYFDRLSTVTAMGGFVTDSTGATMMRIPVSTGGMSVPNNTAYDIIFSVVNRDTNSQLVVAAGSEQVAADSHLGSRLTSGGCEERQEIPATALLEVVRTCGNATTQHGKLR
jgi:hypothetical protein